MREDSHNMTMRMENHCTFRKIPVLVTVLILLSATTIIAQSTAANRANESPVARELFRAMRSLDAVETLDPPQLYHEPRYTKGDTNIIHFSVPTYSSGEDSVSYVLTLLMENGTVLDSIVSVVELDSALLQSQTILSLPYRPLEDGQEYQYATALFIFDREESTLYTSPYADTVRSVQDKSAPEIVSPPEIPALENTSHSGWMDTSTFDLTAGFSDPAGIWQAIVYKRAEENRPWEEITREELPGSAGEYERMYPGDTTLSVLLDDMSDGVHQLRIEGRDAAYSPGSAARPGYELEGNTAIPQTDDTAHVTLQIDTQVPSSVNLQCRQIGNEISLAWNTSEDPGIGVEGYFVIRRYDDTEGTEQVDTLAQPGQTVDDSLRYTDDIPDNDIAREYRYQIQPYDSLGHIQRQGGMDTCRYEPLPVMAMSTEPEYTRGESNTVFWTVDEPGLFTDYRVFAMIRGESTPADSIPVSSGTGEIYEATFEGLSACTEYTFWVETTDEFGRRISSDSVNSTQDQAPPEVQVESGPVFLTTAEISVEFSAWDLCSGSVDSASLYHRSSPDSTWELRIAQDLDETITALSESSPVEASFTLRAFRNGYHAVYIGAKDTAWTAENSGREGNESVPETDTNPHREFYVDTQSPVSGITDMESVQQTICFEIPYSAVDSMKDGYASGLNRVRLYFRHQEMESFQLYGTHTFPETVHSADSSFYFIADSGNGNYQFYTEALDTAGNMQPNARESVRTVQVDGTPEVVQVEPEPGTYQYASDVDCLLVVFDREIRPINNWSDAIGLSNIYNNGAEIEFSIDGETAVKDTLIIRPTSIGAAGSFHLTVDLAQLRNDVEDCPTIAGQLMSSTFYTYMEAGAGGEIRTGEIDLTIPEGEPDADVVFRFSDTTGISCQYEMFQPLSDSAEVIIAETNSAGDTLAGIPGSLTMHYPDAVPGAISEPTLRLFTREEGHCIMVNAEQNYTPNTGENSLTVETGDVTGMFFLLGQGDATTPDEDVAVWNYPNPFGATRSVTKISYYLREGGGDIRMRIYDQFGNLVKTFKDIAGHSGVNTVTWNGINDQGEPVANGGYVCVVIADGRRAMHKIAVMR